MWYRDIGVGVLVGKTVASIVNNGDEILFNTEDGKQFWMGHHQDCCESVRVEDIVGDLDDLLNTTILVAEERTDSGEVEDGWGDSFTWTFYEFRTINGSVTIRWYGTSNGYYSERVSFEDRSEKDSDD